MTDVVYSSATLHVQGRRKVWKSGALFLVVKSLEVCDIRLYFKTDEKNLDGATIEIFDIFTLLQVHNYEIIVKFFDISHNLTWYSAIVHKFTKIYLFCSTYELTKQFM